MNFLVNEFRKSGYSVSYALLNAANYGVPEKRERVIIIGHLGDRVPIPSPTHSENGTFNTAPWVTLHDTIGDLENRDDLTYIPLRAKSMPYLTLLKGGENWRNLPPELAQKAMGKAYFLGGGKTGFPRPCCVILPVSGHLPSRNTAAYSNFPNIGNFPGTSHPYTAR